MVDVATDELNNLNTEVGALILFLTKQNGMMKAYSLMKNWILSNPLPNIDMAKCTVNGVVSPVLKNSFVNSYVMQEEWQKFKKCEILLRNRNSNMEYHTKNKT